MKPRQWTTLFRAVARSSEKMRVSGTLMIRNSATWTNEARTAGLESTAL